MTSNPLAITSVQNPRVKAAVRLRDGKARRESGLFLVEGTRETVRAIRAGIAVDEAFICLELCVTPDRQEAAELAAAAAANVLHVTPEVFSKLSFGDRAEGTLLVAAAPQRTLDDMTLPQNPLVAVLEGIEKPGNFGAVLRSADGAGVSAVIAADGGHDLYNPNAIRASLGAIFTLPVCAATSRDTLAWLRSRELAIYAARPSGGTLYYQVDFTRSAGIVLGSEAHGLSDTWLASDITSIELPMQGVVDSLNVSAAAAVLFYEAQRQRAATTQ
jgi:TrmH family RNA methyltransferase